MQKNLQKREKVGRGGRGGRQAGSLRGAGRQQAKLNPPPPPHVFLVFLQGCAKIIKVKYTKKTLSQNIRENALRKHYLKRNTLSKNTRENTLSKIH